MAIEIIGTGMAVPKRRMTNDELAAEMQLDTSDEWIRSHTGIGARYVSGDDCATSDLAVEASRKALAMVAGLDENASIEDLAEVALSLDMIVLPTATPDYYGAPATSCIVQDKLGAKNAAAMDITAGCTGFIYALETAVALLSVNNRKRILVVGSEQLAKFANWKDRASCVLFGDGAGAVVLEKTSAPDKGEGRRGVISSILKADGSGAHHIIFEKGGARNPFKAGEQLEAPIQININGQAVYNFAVKAMTDTVKEILDQQGLSVDDVSFIVPHQANARIIQAAAKRLKFPEEKCYLNIENYANTSAASIPIALDELNRGGKIKRGDIILTVGFGAGLTYGANLIVW